MCPAAGFPIDGDDNDQLSEAEVDAMVADNGYAMTSDLFSHLFLWTYPLG